MNLRYRILCHSMLAALVLGARIESAPEPRRESATALLDQHAMSVVTVSADVLLVVSVNGRTAPPRTQRREANGTVLSTGGLTVTSLHALDPSASGSSPPNMRVEQVEISNLQIGCATGSSFPAKIVLRRDDLGLILLAPTDSTTPKAFIPVALEPAATPELLAEGYEISRAPQLQQHVAMIRTIAIAGFVAPSAKTPGFVLVATPVSFGSPIFASDGRLLGIGVAFRGEGPVAPGFLAASDIRLAMNNALAGIASSDGDVSP